MASRREEKERLRAERIAREQSEAGSARRRLMVGYVIAGVLGAAVLAGLVVVIAGSGGSGGGGGASACDQAHVQSTAGTTHGLDFDCREGTTPPAIKLGDLAAAAKAAGCELKLDLTDEGNQHVPDSTKVTYKTNPPTSGNHNPTPIADGAYTTPLNTDTGSSPNVRNFVHSMEHGRIEVQYKPSLPEDQQLAIKGVFDEDSDGMLLYPNPDMPYAVAATAWTQLVGCPKYTPAALDVIRDFRDTYRGQGPEQQVPISL